MIKMRIEGLDLARAQINGMHKQVRYATAVALTRTAKAIKDALPAVMDRELDRPTSFTKRGIFIKPATKATLTAVVGLMDKQASYLKWQITGGTQRAGSRGIKLPGNITLNAFGNIPRGLIDKLKQAAKNGNLSGAITRRVGGKTGKGAKAVNLFYGKPTGRGWEKAPMGIYRRDGAKLVPVIVFEDTPAKFKPRFHLERAGLAVVRREWDRIFAHAFTEAMRTAR